MDNISGRSYSTLMQRKVVLVVEDELLIRITLVEVLANAGFDVVEAEGADLALETLDQRSPAVDILFTDVRMPGSIDGLELARRVSVSRPSIAIVVASGNLIPSRSDLPPGSLFLSKPYSFRELPGQLRTLLGEAGAPDDHPA